MFNLLKEAWQNFQSPKVYADIGIDHIELADDYIILGIFLDWRNETAEPITVKEVQIKLFLNGSKKEPILFLAQGNFDRVPGQRVITKTVGAKVFVLPPGQTYLIGIRLYTRAILNIDEGTYPVEIHAMVTGGTYVHSAEVVVSKRMKYRTHEAWVVDE